MALASQPEMRNRMEMIKLLVSHGANVNQRGASGAPPILLACPRGDHKLIEYLMEAGADWAAVDYSNRSILHYAAVSSNPGVFAQFREKGASIHLHDHLDASPLHVAMSLDIFTSIILNSDCGMDLTQPYPWTEMRGMEPTWMNKAFKVYRRRFGDALLRRISDMQPKRHSRWSPLCLMSAAGNIRVMENLLQLGADPDYEGSPHGSALMVACASRQFEAVKLLVQHGASLSYIRGADGRWVSCLGSAQGAPAITRWLLVERFTEQPKINNEWPSLGPRKDDVKPWSGLAKAVLTIIGIHEREPSESSQEYFVRLRELRRKMRGRQVPPAVPGRRTCRPSRLVLWEPVRVHPEDKRAPR